MADRSIRNVDLAVVDLDSPFFTGRTGVLVMEDLAYDVVVGRIPGSKPPRLKDKLLTQKKIDNVCSASTRFVGGC